jgi:hypothetical protein
VQSSGLLQSQAFQEDVDAILSGLLIELTQIAHIFFYAPSAYLGRAVPCCEYSQPYSQILSLLRRIIAVSDVKRKRSAILVGSPAVRKACRHA